MHTLYIEKCVGEQVHYQFKVKICTYRHIFNNEFNLSFGHPKSDTCKTCDPDAASEELTAGYEAPKAERELARNSRSTMLFYNLGVHIIAKDVDKTAFCTWTEYQAGKGSSEIFNSLLRIIEVDVLLKEKYHLILWTDSCSGQNKNLLMTRLYQCIVQKVHFEDGIKWLHVESYGPYLFKECFDYYTPCKEIDILRDPKSKSSFPKDVNIPRFYKKTGSLTSYALFHKNTGGSMNVFHH
ncbi:hypothetical protein PR048_020765, partial [Dryococelus australis]